MTTIAQINYALNFTFGKIAFGFVFLVLVSAPVLLMLLMLVLALVVVQIKAFAKLSAPVGVFCSKFIPRCLK